ncbi:unnamed protein product [Adineta ricciae]|uniref:PRKR-like endoplasmic reticulum kinase n=1 Tax=Adineta ricciae TaxID=249248 RepID=A0A814G8H0_ADIRI|nr:unnamed protein product [Adineta ricciae]CAF1302174.1 unnamed protein product [Adineta ricciae]
MYKHQRNANFHLSFFIRQHLWPIIIPSIAILFLTFCPQISQSIQINTNDYNQQAQNPDRTVAKLGAREVQLKSTVSSLPLSIPPSSTPTTVSFDDSIHALYVISLDGKITAIDARANGRQMWTADTGAPLIDSSLSKIEISRDSRSVRLIPSLIGGLFEKYEEDGHVEPLPFDADSLLDATFKLHDELVINGGKHIDTLGLDLHTGQILYSFSKDNRVQSGTWDNNRTTTTSNTDHGESKPTLIVKRTTQTVRARSARNGYEKWNFSVSNNELLHLRAHSAAAVVLDQVNSLSNSEQGFSGYFQYQLQTGVVLAYDKTGQSVWSSAINAPIAAVWELKGGQLMEKSLFETTTNYVPSDDLIHDDDDDDNDFPPPPKSHRLAFIGEFNSTPYVIVSPQVQKELIYDARKNSGSIGGTRPVLSPWHKVYQKRTLSIGSEVSENNQQRAITAGVSEHNYPLALRPDSTGSYQANSPSSVVETCDTAGYLQLILSPSDIRLREAEKKDSNKNLNTNSEVNLPANALAVSSVVLGALMIFAFYYKHKQNLKLSKELTTTESTSSVSITPPSTPIYHELEAVVPTPPFQSRYASEYEHVRFLGRGGFGVVFEAINKLDERRVAIKRVSLKKSSGKERALKEIRSLAVLNHPNLIQYYYAWNECPPFGWQEEEDKTLLIRTNMHSRDSISTFPTSAASGNDSESVNQVKSMNFSCSSVVHAVKTPPTFEFTFDRSSNPLRIDEEFSSNSVANNDKSNEFSSSTSSSSASGNHNRLDANNNTNSRKRGRLSTTKSSLSSSSPFFDHSIDSSDLSDEERPPANDRTESDDGIIFLHDEKHSSSPSPLPSQSSRSISEAKKSVSSEKDMPPIYFYFVMELCQPESLRDRLTHRSIDRHQAWSIFDQIIKGIEYIHSQKLIHRDLKPNNILFSMENTVKIGDFGLVSAFGKDKSAKKKKRVDEKIYRACEVETISSTTDGEGNNELGGTLLYMSPEQMHQQPYNQKVDIYAIGIILFELLYPFSTQMERMQAITNLRLSKPVFPADFEHDGSNQSRRIHNLIHWLLSESSSDRPRASDLRQSVLYRRILHVEAPDLFPVDNRQKSQTIVSEKDETPMCHSPRGRISSSPFRRTLSSSALDSRKESESGDVECTSSAAQ